MPRLLLLTVALVLPAAFLCAALAVDRDDAGRPVSVVVRPCFLLKSLPRSSLDMVSAAEVVNDPVGQSFKLGAENEAVKPQAQSSLAR